MIRPAGALLALTLGLAACTSGGAETPPAPSTRTETRAAPSTSTPTTSDPIPIDGGPTTTTRVASCPFADQTFVRATMGMRLGRVTVQRAGGKVVGCRIYALQGGSLHRTEHLPGPNQPAVEVITTRYASAKDAHNAFVLRATQGTNAQQVSLGTGVVGACFQNDFDPQDHGRDWACAVNRGATELVVRTVDTTGTFSTAAVTRVVLRAL